MKKVIFISALAIAAAVSCTKSDIVDTKFNEAISFETYTGRDAQTKAAVTNNGNIRSVGIIGYYTGAANWNDGKTPGSTPTPANLMDNTNLTSTNGTTWTYSPAKYWTNDTDKYTFLAYAPYVSSETGATNPVGLTIKSKAPATLSYEVPEVIPSQSDILYAFNPKTGDDNVNTLIDMTKGEGSVTLGFKHALSRLTVKATADDSDFKFDVKKVAISGNFIKKGDLDLATGTWSNATPATEDITYVFYTKASETGTVVKYAADNTVVEKFAALTDKAQALTSVNYAEMNNEANYLMVIPVGASAHTAVLTVDYTTYYNGQESGLNTKTFEVTNDFVKGNAYAINLNFMLDENNQITFDVTVADWNMVNPEQTEYPEGEPEESVTPGEGE